MIVAQLQEEIEKLKEASSKIGLSEEGNYILGKIHSLQGKIKSKELERLHVISKLQWNEWELEHLNALSKETQSLHDQNVALRHNQSELLVAIERYKGLITNYLKKSKTNLVSNCEYLEKEERLGSLLVQFETKEYQCRILESQSQKLAGIITDMIKSKSFDGIIDQIGLQQETVDAKILYDTCTDESDQESHFRDQNDENVESDVFYTPIKPDKTLETGTIKASKFPILDSQTPTLKRQNTKLESPVIKKLKARRESMIPTFNKRRESIRPLGTPRRSARLTKLPMNGTATGHKRFQ